MNCGYLPLSLFDDPAQPLHLGVESLKLLKLLAILPEELTVLAL